jgi:hypothetical protein
MKLKTKFQFYRLIKIKKIIIKRTLTKFEEKTN